MEEKLSERDVLSIDAEMDRKSQHTFSRRLFQIPVQLGFVNISIERDNIRISPIPTLSKSLLYNIII